MLKILPLLIFSFLLIFGESGAQELQKPLELGKRNVDFGKIRQGKALRTRIPFRNISEETIYMSCTNAKGLASKWLSCDVAPEKIIGNDSGLLTITLNANAPAGKVNDSFLFEIRRGKQIIQEEKVYVKAHILPAYGDKNAPELLLENNTSDLDNITSGSQYTCTFRFTNTGSQALNIKVEPGSEADSLKVVYPKAIAAGQQGTISVSFTAIGTGALRKYLFLTTNIPDSKGKILLTIKGKFAR